jgi:hypothetical protein
MPLETLERSSKSAILTKLAARYTIDRFVTTHGPDSVPHPDRMHSLAAHEGRGDLPRDRAPVREGERPRGHVEAHERRDRANDLPGGFYRTKAKQIRAISAILLSRHGGRCSRHDRRGLPPARRRAQDREPHRHLGFGKPGICVDTHVHRIANRLGWVVTGTRRHRGRATAGSRNAGGFPSTKTLVRHGSQVCKPISPLCSSCPVERVPQGRRRSASKEGPHFFKKCAKGECPFFLLL